jgi:hypothetical protein
MSTPEDRDYNGTRVNQADSQRQLPEVHLPECPHHSTTMNKQETG